MKKDIMTGKCILAGALMLFIQTIYLPVLPDSTADASEIIFTKGTTDSLNALAFSYGEAFIQAGDEIIVSGLEHHSNIVP